MDSAQPSIEYMCNLTYIVRNIKYPNTILIKLRSTDGHVWCNDILRDLDATLLSYQEFMTTTNNRREYSNEIYKYLCDLRNTFNRGSWFKKEYQRFTKELTKSFEILFKTFPHLMLNCPKKFDIDDYI